MVIEEVSCVYQCLLLDQALFSVFLQGIFTPQLFGLKSTGICCQVSVHGSRECWNDTGRIPTVYSMLPNSLHPTRCVKCSMSPTSFTLDILLSGCWYITEPLFCISLMTNEVENLFIWVLTTGYPLLLSKIQVICLFFYWAVHVDLKKCFVFSGYKPLLIMCIINISTYFVTYLFTFLIVVFNEQKSLILI